MTTIAYLHDGTSVYDQMFLEHLAKKHTVYFLTFWSKPRFIPKKARTITMREPFRLFADKEWTEGIRMYAFFFLRALLIKLHLRRLKPQLVMGCMATKYGFYATMIRSKPTIVIVWGTDVLIAPKRFIFFRFLAAHALKKANSVIVDSNVQEIAAIQLGCLPKKIVKFPWFNINEITPRKSRSQIRQELGWQNNTIVYCARNHEPIYRVQDLIEAIPQIIREQLDTRFLILGKGSLTSTLKQRVEELGITQYVRFVGAVPRQQAIDYLNASNIYASTSTSDGTSASLLESMTLAIPSVITEIPGNKEWVTNGRNGYLVPVGESRILAEKILHLIRNEDLRHEIGNRARKTVEQKVDWQENMDALDRIIQKLTENKA